MAFFGSRPSTVWGKFTPLLANLVIFHATLDIADVVCQLQAEGWPVNPVNATPRSPRT